MTTTPPAKKPAAKKTVAKVEKPDELDLLFDSAEKKYGSPVGTMDKIGSEGKFLSTGNMSFDIALGGGFAMGRLIELAGPPSCGKTTLAGMAVGEMQKKILGGGDSYLGIGPNDVILYTDFEHAVDKKYMRKLGVDTSHSSLRFTQPDFLEQGADLIVAAVRTGRVRMVVVDSVAQMQPRAVTEAEVGKPLPAIMAKILTPWAITMATECAKNNCMLLFINHEKEVMSMGRPGVTVYSTPGGVALKYTHSQRLSFRQWKKHSIDIIDPITRQPEKRHTSTDISMTVIKNKMAPPGRRALARVRENRGFDNFWSAVQILTAHRYIAAEAGGMFFFHKVEDLIEDWMSMSAAKAQTPARPYIRGQDNLYAQADLHPDWRERVILFAESILPSIMDSDEDVPALTEEEDNPILAEGLAELDQIESA